MTWNPHESCADLFNQCESPAERKFAYAMASSLDLRRDALSSFDFYGPTDYAAYVAAKEFGYVKNQWEAAGAIQTLRVAAQMQKVTLPYRADFMIVFGGLSGTPFYKEIWLEIDGHDYHERTKAQAARDRKKDRAVIAAGYHLMRFTASETHNEPLKCLKEIIDVIVADAWKLPIKRAEYIKDGDAGGESTD